VDGVDVVFIGPTDLSASLGVTGQPQHPTVQAAIQEIIEAVSKTSAAAGILAPNAAAARQWRERGVQYLLTTFESVLIPAAREYLKAVREP